MKFRFILTVNLFFFFFSFSYARNNPQLFDDSDVALQYVEWIRQAIEEERWGEAGSAINRALEFGDVSSDISYLAAYIRLDGGNRLDIICFLDTAIEVNRWEYYSENEALVLKAEQLAAMRRYESAILTLDKIGAGADSFLFTEAVMIRLKAFRGLAVSTGGVSELAAFHSLVNSTMNRFSRDPRPARIFLEYARYLKSQSKPMTASDNQLLDLVIRRLPILAELDPDLAWMAASFMRNVHDARRYVASYRAGGLSQNKKYSLNKNAIPPALYLGLIDDFQAVEELFSSDLHSSEPSVCTTDLEAVTQTYNFLRSEEGRDAFAKALLSFSGTIQSDADHDGIIDTLAVYANGDIRMLSVDKNQENVFDFAIRFLAGFPDNAKLPLTGSPSQVTLKWERYPFVETAELEDEKFNFRPADFSHAPISFVVLGGTGTFAGLNYPVLENNSELTRRTLVSFCSSIVRQSAEFKEASEIISLENGIPLQAVEFIDNKIISVTEFERGIPVIQNIDLDLDGRMETVRRFHRPGAEYPWPEPEDRFDYQRLIASSESDWTGEGRFKTGEVYLQDGLVVYLWDMDGSGTMNYSEENQKK